MRLTPLIRNKARELGHDPVKIHHFVRNRIEFSPTYGSLQDAETTLLNGRGNAADISTLLIALLRASGISCRYVEGSIEVSAESFRNWTGGLESTEGALDLAASGGIPVTGLASGGRIGRVRMEHLWVEAWIDYAPSRGSEHREGDTWIPLDAAYKEMNLTSAADLTRDLPPVLEALLDGWVAGPGDSGAAALSYLTLAGSGIEELAPGISGGYEPVLSAVGSFLFAAAAVHTALIDLAVSRAAGSPDCSCLSEPRPPECDSPREFPVPRDDPLEGPDPCLPDTDQDRRFPAGSEADLSHKEYNLRVTDLSVKVPGGSLEITRRYEADRWVFDHNRFRVVPKCGDLPGCTTVHRVRLNGAEYEPVGGDERLFFRETSQITRDDQDRYTWRDKEGISTRPGRPPGFRGWKTETEGRSFGSSTRGGPGALGGAGPCGSKGRVRLPRGASALGSRRFGKCYELFLRLPGKTRYDHGSFGQPAHRGIRSLGRSRLGDGRTGGGVFFPVLLRRGNQGILLPDHRLLGAGQGGLVRSGRGHEKGGPRGKDRKADPQGGERLPGRRRAGPHHPKGAR
ncbi:MAG TPA: transglutaminase-like domain-containing protein [Syntrophobacteraceae bacterium]|nr:transglutaminase-like domain-containing protein [Syntrophobacteraceae bacterium]